MKTKNWNIRQAIPFLLILACAVIAYTLLPAESERSEEQVFQRLLGSGPYKGAYADEAEPGEPSEFTKSSDLSANSAPLFPENEPMGELFIIPGNTYEGATFHLPDTGENSGSTAPQVRKSTVKKNPFVVFETDNGKKRAPLVPNSPQSWIVLAPEEIQSKYIAQELELLFKQVGLEPLSSVE